MLSLFFVVSSCASRCQVTKGKENTLAKTPERLFQQNAKKPGRLVKMDSIWPPHRMSVLSRCIERFKCCHRDGFEARNRSYLAILASWSTSELLV